MTENDSFDDRLPTGISVEELPALMREIFLACVEDARASVAPEDDFEEFVDALWEHVSAAFGLIRREWPDAPLPWAALVDRQRSLAEELLDDQSQPGRVDP